MARFEGKVVAITGASSGIGEATARMLAGDGAKVVLGARGSERLEALTQSIESDGGAAAYIVTDVRRREDLAKLVGLACQRFDRLDVLVSNAGVGPIAPLDELRVDEWEDTIDINVKGVLYGVAAALPVFRAQGSGHFVNIASTAAHRIVPNMAVYAASNFAVRAFSEGNYLVDKHDADATMGFKESLLCPPIFKRQPSPMRTQPVRRWKPFSGPMVRAAPVVVR